MDAQSVKPFRAVIFRLLQALLFLVPTLGESTETTVSAEAQLAVQKAIGRLQSLKPIPPRVVRTPNQSAQTQYPSVTTTPRPVSTPDYYIQTPPFPEWHRYPPAAYAAAQAAAQAALAARTPIVIVQPTPLPPPKMYKSLVEFDGQDKSVEMPEDEAEFIALNSYCAKIYKQAIVSGTTLLANRAVGTRNRATIRKRNATNWVGVISNLNTLPRDASKLIDWPDGGAMVHISLTASKETFICSSGDNTTDTATGCKITICSIMSESLSNLGASMFITENSPIYGNLLNAKKGMAVKFSGTFHIANKNANYQFSQNHNDNFTVQLDERGTAYVKPKFNDDPPELKVEGNDTATEPLYYMRFTDIQLLNN